MNKRFLIVALFLFGSTPVFSAAVFQMGLKEAEESAISHSPKLQSARSDAEAASLRAKSQFAILWPKLSFDASYRYVTEVPSFAPAPGAPKTKFGDNNNYSYGPAINWLLDSGNIYNRWRSAQAQWRAKQRDYDAAERQLILETQLDYFQVQLGCEQVRLLIESLKVAEAQYKDISLRYKAGSSSRLDSLSSHQEVLNRSRQLLQARADLANALEMLFTITGSTPPADIPSLIVTLDPVEQSQKTLTLVTERAFDANHPQLASLSEQIQASEKTIASLRAGHFPYIQLQAKTTRDYPNGPVRESIHQNTVGVAASFPLFEFGRVTYDVTQQQNIMRSTEFRREQVMQDLERDWQKARDQWQSLEKQQEIFRESIREIETIQRLTYESYQAGQVTYLEVQNANLRVLESKVVSARNDVQLLIQLAILNSLSVKE